MRLSFSRYPALLVLLLTAFPLMAPTQAALAHGHGEAVHRAIHHHHYSYAIASYRRHIVIRYSQQGLYAYAYGHAGGYEMQPHGGSGLAAQSASSDGYSEPFQGSTFQGGYRNDRRAAAIGAYDGMIAAQAGANGVPTSLIERVIRRESGGNARAVSRGNYGLMQIRLGTARAMGYTGPAAGLLDASTNMTYAVRYLAGAYRAAGGNESRAVALYARGYNARPVQAASAYQAYGDFNAPSAMRPTSVAYNWQPQTQTTWRSGPSTTWSGSEWQASNWQPGYYRVGHYRHRRV